MICVVALVVFGILGVFSLSYRKLAAEAFDCVFRRVTFRKCDSAFDVRMKGRLVGKLLRLNKTFAKFVYRYFEIFSWALVILMLVSAYFAVDGLYNYAIYGNCNGDDGGFCPMAGLDGEGECVEESFIEHVWHSIKEVW